LMRIDVQQSNSNQKISCYGNLSKIWFEQQEQDLLFNN
jgi:hypothetical protein